MVDQELTYLVKISYITNIIFHSIACPFTVLLNVLVILAVKSRPRLRNKPNILLACLAVTDAMNGLAAQPAFIFSTTLKLLLMTSQTLEFFSQHRLTRPVRLFCPAPDVGYLGETCSDQIHHALPLHCHKQKHQAGSDCILDCLSFLWTSSTYYKPNNIYKRFNRSCFNCMCYFCFIFLRDVVQRNATAWTFDQSWTTSPRRKREIF